MKRLLTLAAMFLCCMATSFAQFSGSGSGTENDPYLIMNPIQLNQLRNYLNTEGVYFKMMADIDLTEFLEDESPSQGWQPIGNSSSSVFKGVIDGNGKTIAGLWIKRRSNDCVGFFGYTSNATIKNITVIANTIEGKEFVGGIVGHSVKSTISGVSFEGNIRGDSQVGGIVGYSNNSTIDHISFEGNIQGNSQVGGIVGSSEHGLSLSDCGVTIVLSCSGDNIGGFVGKNDAYNFSISNCQVNNGTISGMDNVGGACGGNIGDRTYFNELSNCYIHANVIGNNHVGGVCGKSENRDRTVNMEKCGFIGNVRGTTYVGGLTGYNKNTYGSQYEHHQHIQNCFAIGTINASGNYAGGLIAFDDGIITSEYYHSSNYISNCYFSGSVSGNDYTGGLVGYKYEGTISNCYLMASVTGAKYVGGLVGFNAKYAGVQTSVAINTRVTATEGEVARLVGYNEGNIAAVGSATENKSFNRTIVIDRGIAKDVEDDAQNGTGVSATTLKLKATYVAMSWDFTDIWDIQETECYPYFKTQTAPPVITSQVVSGATTISGNCVSGGTITLEIDGVKQQAVSSGNTFSFTVSPLQVGQEIWVSAKAEGKEPSYYAMATVSFMGKGTESDPYQVYTAGDLKEVYRKGYFKLMNDIDLTSYINTYGTGEGWEAIGRDGSETICFDGNGHKITGLWCNTTRDNTGLFSCFANGYIKNLTVETASGKQVKGGNYTGIIIGKLINGEITNCKAFGTVADGTPVGGMIGKLDGGKLLRCQTNVTINVTGGNSYVGGLAGEITGDVEECLSNGTLTATGSNSYAGGLVGLVNSGSNITNCYSNAKVSSSYNAAGLVAYNYGVVDKCYATGDLFSKNYGAGVIGYNDGANAVVKNCVAMNNKIDVTYESQQQQQGGGYGQRIIGGIKNGAPAPELNNYALKTMQVSLNNKPQKVYDDIMNGTAKTGAELMKYSTYQELGWDFSKTWTISEGEGYPSLKNNEAVVGKAEEEPEPTPTNDDKLTVATVNTSSGKTATIGINLENLTTDLTAYQFDLILPEGFTLATDSKGKFQVTKTSRYEDDNQQLTVSLQEDGSYRFISFSMSNGKIEGTNGAILNAVMASADNVTAGTYEGTIKNIVFTKADGTQLKLNDAKFIIVVSNMIMGDANGDGEVNVSDIVEIVNYIMGKPSANFVQAAADLNGDGEVNVTDIVKVVSIIMDTNSSSARVRRKTMNNKLSLKSDGLQKTAILQHAGEFTATQFDVILNNGQEIDNITLNSNSDHCLTWKMAEEGRCRVVVYSLTNSAFNVNGSDLMSIRLKGKNSEITVGNVILVAAKGNTTGLNKLTTDTNTGNWYTLDGRKLDKQPSEKGIYIKKGKKFVVR